MRGARRASRTRRSRGSIALVCSAGAPRGRDPVNSYVAFRGTASGGNTASMTGEVGAGRPLITATSTGFAVAYRSALGLRVFDGAGTRTLDPDPAVFDLVTWADRAVLVWTTIGDARPRLTRLCP